MIAKVRNNGLIKMAAMAALLYLCFLPAGHAAESVLGGSVIQATPYDHRLDGAGAFSSAGSVLGQLHSSDDLFRQARSIRYAADAKGQDYWQSPQETQARWAGDCEDKALWLFSELKKNGHSNVRLVVGRFRSSGGYHVWVTMGDDEGHVWVLDPTAQKKIWKSSDFGPGYYKALYSFDGIHRYRHDA